MGSDDILKQPCQFISWWKSKLVKYAVQGVSLFSDFFFCDSGSSCIERTALHSTNDLVEGLLPLCTSCYLWHLLTFVNTFLNFRFVYPFSGNIILNLTFVCEIKFNLIMFYNIVIGSVFLRKCWMSQMRQCTLRTLRTWFRKVQC